MIGGGAKSFDPLRLEYRYPNKLLKSLDIQNRLLYKDLQYMAVSY